MKNLMTAALAVGLKILAGERQAGAASFRQCLLSPVSGSTERERQLNRLNRPGSLRVEVSGPHTGRLPAVAAGSSASACSESSDQGW